MTDKRCELPLCSSRYIDAVTTVSGEGAALQLLREWLNLRASARLLYVPEANCYFVELDDIDRWKNPRVGMTEAVSTMPFKAADILKAEIKSWEVSNFAHIVDPVALHVLIDLGVINSDNIDSCAVEARAVFNRKATQRGEQVLKR